MRQPSVAYSFEPGSNERMGHTIFDFLAEEDPSTDGSERSMEKESTKVLSPRKNSAPVKELDFITTAF